MPLNKRITTVKRSQNYVIHSGKHSMYYYNSSHVTRNSHIHTYTIEIMATQPHSCPLPGERGRAAGSSGGGESDESRIRRSIIGWRLGRSAGSVGGGLCRSAVTSRANLRVNCLPGECGRAAGSSGGGESWTRLSIEGRHLERSIGSAGGRLCRSAVTSRASMWVNCSHIRRCKSLQ